MAGTSLFALLDDIATLLDDVAVLTKLLLPSVLNGIVGLAAGALALAGVTSIKRLLPKKAAA